jgi:hypothetical protein
VFIRKLEDNLHFHLVGFSHNKPNAFHVMNDGAKIRLNQELEAIVRFFNVFSY